MFCRLCGNKLTETSLDVLTKEHKNLALRIKTVLKIQIRQKDEYQKICLLCRDKVETFYNYYEDVQKTQEELKGKHVKDLFEPVQVKIEFDDDSLGSFSDAIELKKEPEVIVETVEKVVDTKNVMKDESMDVSDGGCEDDEADKDKTSKRTEYKEMSEKINSFYNFTCGKCGINVGNPFGFQLHMKRVHKIRNATISCCGKDIPSIRTELLYHYFTHTNIEATICRFCGKQFNSMKYLRKHEQNHVEKLTKAPIPCPECGKLMLGQLSLKSHLRNMHTPEELRPSYVCDLCGKVVKDKNNLRQHFIYAHKIGQKPVQVTDPNKTEEVLCPVCAKSFKTDSGFKTHFKAHHDIEKVMCPECGQEINKLSLKNHMRRLHDHEAQACDICFKEFRNKHAVGHHKNRVHITPRHECDLCEKKFKTKDKLKDHRRGHFVENRFHCDMCNVTCNDYSNILKHRKQVHQAPPLPKGMGRKILEIGF